MRDEAFDRESTLMETAMQRRQRRGNPTIYLLPPRTPRTGIGEWGHGFLTGLILAAVTVFVAMVTR